MLQFDLGAQVRTSFGKSAAKSMRREGISPAIMYGAKNDPLAIQLNTRELTKVMIQLQRRNAVFNLDVSGSDDSSSKRHVMIQEIQTDPVDDSLIHTDFLEVALDQPISLEVPVKYVGTSKGVDLGGELHVSLQKVSVKGLVLDIPDLFEIDITDMVIGDTLSCEKIDIADGLELLNDSTEVCVSVQTAKKEREEEEEVAEEEAAEPEAASA